MPLVAGRHVSSSVRVIAKVVRKEVVTAKAAGVKVVDSKAAEASVAASAAEEGTKRGERDSELARLSTNGAQEEVRGKR